MEKQKVKELKAIAKERGIKATTNYVKPNSLRLYAVSKNNPHVHHHVQDQYPPQDQDPTK